MYGGTLSLDSCVFDSNTIVSKYITGGGGVYIQNPTRTLSFTSCTFQSNYLNTTGPAGVSATGAGIMIEKGTATLAHGVYFRSCTFTENRVVFANTVKANAFGQGAGVYLVATTNGWNTVTFKRCTFARNTLQVGWAGPGGGGVPTAPGERVAVSKVVAPAVSFYPVSIS